MVRVQELPSQPVDIACRLRTKQRAAGLDGERETVGLVDELCGLELLSLRLMNVVLASLLAVVHIILDNHTVGCGVLS